MKIINLNKFILYCFILLLFINFQNILTKKISLNIKNSIPLELTNYYYPKNNQSPDEEVIAIMGTNDVHGGAYEKNLEYQSQKFEKGGFKYLSGVLDIIREEYKDNFLWLDAGDQFTGTYDNIVSEGKTIRDFYNLMKVDACTLGNHEWDRGENWLRENMQLEKGRYFNKKNLDKNNSTFLVANLIPKNGTEDLPNKSSSKIFTMKNGVKIGVIGLTTYETLYNTKHPPKNFEVLDYYNTTITEAKKLRILGVDAIVLLTHIGTHCKGETPEELMQLKLRDENYMKNSTDCDDELGELARRLKDNEVDLIIGGEGVEAHHFINGIPIVQNTMTTVSSNIAYLIFKKINFQGKKKFELVKKYIEGPVPLCSKIFEDLKRCDFVPEEKNKKLVEFTWHGKKIIPNKNIHKIFENFSDKIIKKSKKNIIFETEIRLERGNQKDNFLGGLLCDMIRNITDSQVCVIDYSSLRTFWEIGKISEYDVMNMFPFGGNIVKFSVKGKELKFLIKTLQEGKKSYYGTSGLSMKISENCGKIKKLISVVLRNGKEIGDDKIYTLSGFDFFLLKGSADMKKVLEDRSNFSIPIKIKDYGDLRERLMESFRNIRVISKNQVNVENRIELIKDFKKDCL